MEIKPIKTEADYRAALKRLEEIFDAKADTPERDELEILGLMVDDFENKHYPIEAPDPIEAIKIRMEEMNLKQIENQPLEQVNLSRNLRDIIKEDKELLERLAK